MLVDSEAPPRPLEIRNDSGRLFLIGTWPDETIISNKLMETPPAGMRIERGDLRIELTNGSAVYRRVGDADYGTASLYRKLVSSVMRGA